jgi:hypothetical protein
VNSLFNNISSAQVDYSIEIEDSLIKFSEEHPYYLQVLHMSLTLLFQQGIKINIPFMEFEDYQVITPSTYLISSVFKLIISLPIQGSVEIQQLIPIIFITFDTLTQYCVTENSLVRVAKILYYLTENIREDLLPPFIFILRCVCYSCILKSHDLQLTNTNVLQDVLNLYIKHGYTDFIDY